VPSVQSQAFRCPLHNASQPNTSAAPFPQSIHPYVHPSTVIVIPLPEGAGVLVAI
jgi:hypothetical protein